MNLSPRLMAMISFVPVNSIAADIGTDHGYIPVYLIKNGISKKVIASDISYGSLGKAKNYTKISGYENFIETRLGDGLEVIKPFEADTAIIGGMGGLLIRDILNFNKELTNSIQDFILQPMVASEELRRYLYENNFRIIDEKLVKEEDKYYEIIYAKKGKDYIEKEIFFEIGKKLIENRDPLLQEFVSKKVKYNEEILKDLEGKDSLKSIERSEELKEKIQQYKEVLRLYESL